MSSKALDTIDVRGTPASNSRPINTSYLADISRLVALYCAWKIFLLAVVLASPGPGYDTSTTLLFDQHGTVPSRPPARLLYDISLRLTRWDGIYFTSASVDGYVFEQQWAFSWAFTRTTAIIAHVLPSSTSLPSIVKHALVASTLSLIAHLAAVILLYLLVLTVLPSPSARKRQTALTAACLHIISPAGVFLIAPYGEAAFALFNMAGMLSYAHAVRNNMSPSLMLLAGTSFGLATMVRSNGLLSGIIFAWDALALAFSIIFGTRSTTNMQRLATSILAGSFVAVGFALPQYIAYRQYCNADIVREWCSNMPPSIYSWVQEHYWDVGFLKYWTLSNIPLFLLAAPVLFLLLNTGYGALHHARSLLMAVNGEERPSLTSQQSYQADRSAFRHIMERFAVPQMILALLAAFSFHVQIINRVSSGYPVWYLVLAMAIDDQSPMLECGHPQSQHYYPFRQLRGKLPRIIVQGFVVYAVVQAGLFSSFLPPA